MTQQFAGESGLDKGMFAASKAFAMAQSIVSITQGVANTDVLPFPSNLATGVMSEGTLNAYLLSEGDSEAFLASEDVLDDLVEITLPATTINIK